MSESSTSSLPNFTYRAHPRIGLLRREDGKGAHVRVIDEADASPVSAIEDVDEMRCDGCAEQVWHSVAYHEHQAASEPTPAQRAKRELEYRRRNDARNQPGGIIEQRDVRIVATRGSDGTWAAYWKPLDALGGDIGFALTQAILADGDKLAAEGARFGLFPNIVGEYRS